jgi:anti-anti-sigma regulatory factor
LKTGFFAAMVFSFFKKVPEKMVSRPAAAPRPREMDAAPAVLPAEGKPAALGPAAEVKPLSVDVAKAVDPADVPLDFSDFDFSESPQDFQIEVDVDPVDADVEQAAVLYANGQDEVARTFLENAVRVHHFGPGERLWLMLFDLYRLTAQKAAFEILEIEYAQAFEKSPPAWRDSSKPIVAAKAAVGSALFKGELLGDNDAGFDTARLAMEKNPKFRLDLSKVKHLDASGCGRLLALLQQARKNKREIELLGRDNIGALVEGHVETGRAEEGECWLLLLELLQLQGQQEAFDDAAINYAVTFEVSPPSWEPKRVAAAEPVPVVASTAAVDDTDDLAYIARGDIKAFRFGDLPAFAEAHDPVIIDCSAVTRVDFISAGALLNVLSIVRRSGKQIVFRYPNHLVAELFGVVGLRPVAEIIFEKY